MPKKYFKETYFYVYLSAYYCIYRCTVRTTVFPVWHWFKFYYRSEINNNNYQTMIDMQYYLNLTVYKGYSIQNVITRSMVLQ